MTVHSVYGRSLNLNEWTLNKWGLKLDKDMLNVWALIMNVN